MKNVIRSTRAGFSLVELLIALTLTAVVGAAMTGLFVTQARFLEIQQQAGYARSVTRSAMNIMTSEMRMIDPDSGVTLAMDTAIVLRVPFAMGVNCKETITSVTFELLPVDSVMYAQGIAAIASGNGGFAYRQADDKYKYISTTNTPATGNNSDCTGDPPGISIISGGLVKSITALMLHPISRGQPIILYQNIRYHFNASTTVTGKRGLFRTQNGTDEEIAAPFDTTAKFNWYVNDSKTPQTTAPTNLKSLTGIDLILNTVNEKPSADGTLQMIPMRTAVFFKNRRN
jgi:prepilin-type N-terminal cleavage/methylation domain-containing protein